MGRPTKYPKSVVPKRPKSLVRQHFGDNLDGQHAHCILYDQEQHVHLADHLQCHHSQADYLNVDLMRGRGFRYEFLAQENVQKLRKKCP